MLSDTAEFERFVLRHEDYSLSSVQQDLRETYARLLAAHAPFSRVRAVESEPPWFDAELWTRMRAMGATTLGLPEQVGGDGGGLVELALVAEEVGRTGSSTALAETAAVGRMLARLGTARDSLAGLRDGSRLVSPALDAQARPGRQLVPCGTVADEVVALVGGELVRCDSTARAAPVRNLAGAPLAWWNLGTASVLAAGTQAADLFARMRREWNLLTAAALIGVARRALADAVEYAKNRCAFGLPIGAYQAVSHPLVNIEMAVTAGRRLIHKAAWFEDHEPGTTTELTLGAISFAAETAASATSTGVHTMGGLGVTDDADMQLLFRRAKGWSLFGGNAQAELARAFAGPGRPVSISDVGTEVFA
jgi:alkylation response protein AidB-like acyl-CoA dehydrogenase